MPSPVKMPSSCSKALCHMTSNHYQYYATSKFTLGQIGSFLLSMDLTGICKRSIAWRLEGHTGIHFCFESLTWSQTLVIIFIYHCLMDNLPGALSFDQRQMGVGKGFFSFPDRTILWQRSSERRCTPCKLIERLPPIVKPEGNFLFLSGGRVGQRQVCSEFSNLRCN